MRKKRASKQALVSNTSPQELVSLTLNLLPKSCRVDNLEGQEYTVIPMVILTEGVHAGSMGPLYYPKDELAKTPQAWNHKPIVVYHPTMNGVGVSACDPVIINSRKVGLMMNTQFKGGKLKSEAWIRKDRAEAVDERIMSAVASGEMMELSTGVYVDVDETEGEYFGEEYKAVARNYRPDHLALLPDQIGACSIADGAGLMRNAGVKKERDGDHPSSHYLMLEDAAEPSSWQLRIRGKDGKPDHRLMGAAWAALSRGDKYSGPMKKSALRKLKGLYESEGLDTPTANELLENELSFDGIRSALCDALMDRFPVKATVIQPYPMSPYVRDVYSNFFIFERDGQLYRLGYTSNDTEVQLSEDEPVEVVRVSEYRTVQNTETTIMDKELTDLVEALIGNAPWSKEDRDRLSKMPKEQLKSLAAIKKADPTFNISLSAAPAPANNNAPAAPSPAPAPVAPKPVSAPAEPKLVTVNEYIAAAPREVADVLQNGLDIYNEEKATLLAIITANENNAFSKEELVSKPLGELRKLARLMGSKPEPQNRVPLYAGQGPTPTDNTQAEEALVMPAISFGK